MSKQSTYLPSFANLNRDERISRKLSVALVGYGRQGEVIADTLLRIPGVQLAALADIWPWRREIASKRLRAQRCELRCYETVEELLNAEEDAVDAVVVSTPDWQHFNHVSACLNGNKHVYCEGELAETASHSERLVKLAKQKGLLVQCGHFRRSSPRYIHIIDTLNRKHNIPGLVTHLYSQWHKVSGPLLTVPRHLIMSTAELQRHGYETMEQLLNWEWHTRFGLGDVAYRTGQKLDIIRWFWDAEPVSVTSLGSNDYFHRDALDCLMSLFTFKLPGNEVRRGYVQVLSATSAGGEKDAFGAEYLSVTTSENISPDVPLLRVRASRPWWLRDYDIFTRIDRACKEGALFYRKELPEDAKNPDPDSWGYDDPRIFNLMFPFQQTKTTLQLHLENFIAGIRDGEALRDPIEQAHKNMIALEAAVRSAHERRTIDLASP